MNAYLIMIFKGFRTHKHITNHTSMGVVGELNILHVIQIKYTYLIQRTITFRSPSPTIFFEYWEYRVHK